MGYKLKTAPTIEPITLAEAKIHLKVDSDTTDDLLISALISAAREACEKYTGRVFIEQSWEYVFEDFKDDEIELDNPPLISVTSLTYKDISGVTETIATSVYDVDTHSYPGSIFLKFGQLWPLVQDVENAIMVTYKAGYGATAASVPASIMAAMLLIIGHLYENREDVITGRQVNELPKGSKYLLDPFKVYCI